MSDTAAAKTQLRAFAMCSNRPSSERQKQTDVRPSQFRPLRGDSNLNHRQPIRRNRTVVEWLMALNQQ